MAHPPEVKARVRAAYIYDRLNLEVAAAKHGVKLSTAHTWKVRDARRKGDDWDKARAASGLSSSTIDEFSREILNDFLLMFKSTQDIVRNAQDIGGLDKVQALSSMADSFSKMVSNVRRLLPEINKAVVAKELIDWLAEFIAAQYPQHLPVFAEILGPFAEHLTDRLQAPK